MKILKITVVTICKNCKNTIENTIKSVIYQNYADLEYIVVDGGSTDGTLEIIEKYRDSITTLISEPDKGISDAFNKGICLATGEIIGLMNASDLYYKGALKTVADYFEMNPKTDVSFGNIIRFEKGSTVGYVTNANPDVSRLKTSFDLNHSTVFVRKSAYEKYGVFDIKYKIAMDYDLLSRMYFDGANFGYINNVLACFEQGGISGTQISKSVDEHIEIAYKHGANVGEMKKYAFYHKYVEKNAVTILRKLGLLNLARKLLKDGSMKVVWWE